MLANDYLSSKTRNTSQSSSALQSLSKLPGRVDELQAANQDLKKVQDRIESEQSWQRNLLYMGWIVIVVTMVATVIALFSFVIDFYNFKNYYNSNSESKGVNNINIYISTSSSFIKE